MPSNPAVEQTIEKLLVTALENEVSEEEMEALANKIKIARSTYE